MKVDKKSDGRSKYSSEFRGDAVGLVIEGQRLVADVAGSLGIAPQTLWNWVRQARIDRGEKQGLTTDQKKRLVELEKENRQLKMERDLLKRAAAFFAKESQ